MKTSEVFTHAKKCLSTDYHRIATTASVLEKFICLAIGTAASHSKRITDNDVERCVRIIESRLEGETTFESWLQLKGCVHRNWALVNYATRQRVQQHRHAWLDMLIAEFEAKGD